VTTTETEPLGLSLLVLDSWLFKDGLVGGVNQETLSEVMEWNLDKDFN